MEVVLYKKNLPILKYEEDDRYYITSIKEIYNISHIPPHCFLNGRADVSNEYAICQRLEEFLDRRLIPYQRKNLNEALKELNINSPVELAKKSFYLSLSDQYWVCPAQLQGKIKWEDINFFTNEYDDALGLRLVDSLKRLNKNSSSMSPDNTTDGELSKRWLRKDGLNYLEKAGTGSEQQEPLNEVLAYQICHRLKISAVPYELEIRNENYFSRCPDIANENTEMIPLDSIYQDLHLIDGKKYDFKLLCRRCEDLKIPHAEDDLLKIIVLDFIIANVDRHSYNIAFLRDSNTLEFKGVSPVYDSGKSMFLNLLPFEMDMTSSYRIGAKPFEETQMLQFKNLPVEKVFGLLDFSALSDICQWYTNFLKPLKRISEEKKAKLVEKLSERIVETQSLLKQKLLSSYGEGNYSINNSCNGLMISDCPSPTYEASKKTKFSTKVPSDEQVFLALCQNSRQTKEQLGLSTGLSRATVTRALQKLEVSGRICRIGANKNGYWKIM